MRSFDSNITILHLDGTSKYRSKCCRSWIEHWRRNARSRREQCSILGCNNIAEVGSHVKIDSHAADETYIIPCCYSCNNTGGIMKLKKRVKLVSDSDCRDIDLISEPYNKSQKSYNISPDYSENRFSAPYLKAQNVSQTQGLWTQGLQSQYPLLQDPWFRYSNFQSPYEPERANYNWNIFQNLYQPTYQPVYQPTYHPAYQPMEYSNLYYIQSPNAQSSYIQSPSQTLPSSASYHNKDFMSGSIDLLSNLLSSLRI